MFLQMPLLVCSAVIHTNTHCWKSISRARAVSPANFLTAILHPVTGSLPDNPVSAHWRSWSFSSPGSLKTCALICWAVLQTPCCPFTLDMEPELVNILLGPSPNGQHYKQPPRSQEMIYPGRHACMSSRKQFSIFQRLL